MGKIRSVLPALWFFAVVFIVIGAASAAAGGNPRIFHSIAFFFFLLAEFLGVVGFVILGERHWSVLLSVLLATLFLFFMVRNAFV